MVSPSSLCIFFFFNDTATTEIYTLSLHDALPIYEQSSGEAVRHAGAKRIGSPSSRSARGGTPDRSEEHTSELQSLAYLVCRLLLEKKKKRRRQDSVRSVAYHTRRPVAATRPPL